MTQQSQNTDARHFSRIQFSIPVTLSNTDQQWQANLIDISLHGSLISRPEHWKGKIGETYRIELFLGDDSAIIMEVKAVHVEPASLGFACEHIDLDSITHLRRLVELNLGNEEILERELSELMHINDHKTH